jgi:multicomponent K+:H+ antiporter subunit E
MSRTTRRWLPSPGLSLALAVLWPVLNSSFSLGQIALGLLLGWWLPWWLQGIQGSFGTGPSPSRWKKPRVAATLAWHVLSDIVTSNIDVAGRILGAESRIRPRFVWLPLQISSPQGRVALAGIITMTPGTLSADFSADERHLLVHALHVDDEAALLHSIHLRYEQPLMEIFD